MTTQPVQHLRRQSISAMIALGLAVALCLSLAGPAHATGSRWKMFQQTNGSRDRHDVKHVSLYQKINDLVDRHSRQLARRNELFHTRDVSDYLRGVNWHAWGENVGYTDGGTWSLERAFMRSLPHRHNILNNTFDHVAVGTARAHGKLWVTVFFYG